MWGGHRRLRTRAATGCPRCAVPRLHDAAAPADCHAPPAPAARPPLASVSAAPPGLGGQAGPVCSPTIDGGTRTRRRPCRRAVSWATPSAVGPRPARRAGSSTTTKLPQLFTSPTPPYDAPTSEPVSAGPAKQTGQAHGYVARVRCHTPIKHIHTHTHTAHRCAYAHIQHIDARTHTYST
jgi:hypothetical protein